MATFELVHVFHEPHIMSQKQFKKLNTDKFRFKLKETLLHVSHITHYNVSVMAYLKVKGQCHDLCQGQCHDLL